MHGRTSFTQLADDLASGRRTALSLTEECLARIVDPAGEGRTTFLKVHGGIARISAENIDRLRRHGVPLPRFAGIPISVKDLFDVSGEVTSAGSRALVDAVPADKDCVVVERLRKAGFIIIGRTNMTEFAYSGLGLNPHFGTPRNPWDRGAGRIPGGSSSGAAISVTDKMAYAGLGSDTGGSCRIPAAFTGLVGWKPTARRVPLDGVLPLSFSLDSVGCLAASTVDCAFIDRLVSGEEMIDTLDDVAPTRLRFAIPNALVLNNLDDIVAETFNRALKRLTDSGASLERVSLPELSEIPSLSAKGGIVAAEAYTWHRSLLERKGELYDPRVRVRILFGHKQEAADYIDLIHRRADLIRRVRRKISDFDALVMPTVPIVAPKFTELERDDDYSRLNLLTLRNPSLANFLNLCSISLPVHELGNAPVGLMLIADHMADHRLLRIANGIEKLFGDTRLN